MTASSLPDRTPGRSRHGVLVATADFKAANPSAVYVDTHNARAAAIVVPVTALSGAGCTVTVTVEAVGPDGTTVSTLVQAAITATGVYRLMVGDVATVSGLAFNCALPAQIKVTAARSGTNTTLTYGIQAEVS